MNKTQAQKNRWQAVHLQTTEAAWIFFVTWESFTDEPSKQELQSVYTIFYTVQQENPAEARFLPYPFHLYYLGI